MNLLSIKERYAKLDEITKNRIDTVLPRLLKEAGIDMWLVLASEYNEDPVFKTIVPGVMINASRMTCIIFSIGSEGDYEAVSINKPNAGLARFYRQLKYNTDTQWEAITDYIKSRNPKKIGINISSLNGMVAGLSHGLYSELIDTIGAELSSRLVSAEKLATRWLEHRTEPELELYPHIYDVTTSVMNRAFSKEVVHPGITSTEDVEYWVAEEFSRQGLPQCFPVAVNLQRQGMAETMASGIIRHGDLLHYDAGIEYLGLCTDHQRLAYVLKPGERAAPQGIVDGFKTGRQFGYLVAEEYIAGRTGNEIFSQSIKRAGQAGIKASLYTHPIGKYCHAAGPTIGLYDKQAFIPGRGEIELYHNTAYALEYNVCCPVAEWGQDVYFYLEETVTFTEDGKLNYLDNLYNRLILI